MKKICSLLVFVILILSCNNEGLDNDQEEQACDNGTFSGNVNLSTQTEVNDFGALCYTKINGSLVIDDLNETEDKIMDLSPLQNLIEIFTENPEISWGSLHLRTTMLTNFEGLNNLESVARLTIQFNESITSLQGLENLSSVGSLIEIPVNEIKIIGNPELQNLEGLNNLVKIGFGNNLSRFEIIGNASLQNVDGLEGLIEINSSESISGIPSSGNLWIYANHELISIDGLLNLTNMHGGHLSFISVGDLIGSDGCPSVSGNDALQDFCGLQNVLSNGDYGGLSIGYFGNCYDGFTPTAQDIIDGNCSQ